MRVMRAEPSRFADVTAQSVGAVWRAYDLQLTTYAALLGVFGLVMAYTNSVEAGQSIMDNGTVFSRALMWSGLAIVVFIAATAFDYRWLKTLVWPIYVVNLGLLVLTLAIGDGVGGSARWVSVGPLTFQFSELAKILMITVLAVYLGNREGRLDSLRLGPGRVPAHGPGGDPGHGAARPRLVARPGRDPRRDAVHVRGEPALADRDGGRARDRGAPVLELHPARLPEGPDPVVLQPERRHPGLGLAGAAVADHRRVGRAARHRPHQRDAVTGRLPAGPGERLRVRGPGAGAGLHRGPRGLPAVRRADLADPVVRLALEGPVRHAVRGRASRRCCCSRCS